MRYLLAIVLLVAAMLAGQTLPTSAPAPNVDSRPASKPHSRPAAGTFKDVEYGRVGKARLLMDIYLPSSPRPLPVVVWIHGGAWIGGSKGNCPAVGLASQGYAVVSIDYRLGVDVGFVAEVQDCKAAIRFLRANARKYNLDASHIGAWGESAGGHLAAMLGLSAGVTELEGEGNLDQSSAVQIVVDFCGPSDLPQLSKDLNRLRPKWPCTKLLANGVARDPKAAVLASPMTHVSAAAAPFLIVHGDRDTTVPLDQSRNLDDAMKKRKAACELIVVPGAGHGGLLTPKVRGSMMEFLAKHLKPKPQTTSAASGPS